MSNRSKPVQAHPDPSKDYRDFPVYTHRQGLRLYRTYQEKYDPWYFSSVDGRFNLRDPYGTLNLARSPEIAAREYLGVLLVGNSFIPATAFTGRLVAELEVDAVRAADFTSSAAVRFGVVPGEISAPAPDYSITRSWAENMHKANFEGIWSRSRFAGGVNPYCLYVFGPSGQHYHGSTMSKQTLRSVVKSMPGYTIDSIPSSTDLVVED